MGESNLDSIERAGLQDAPSPELVQALSLRRKIIARNIELTWRIEIPWKDVLGTGKNGNGTASGNLGAI
jgi:hypothetical protein